MRHLHLRLRVTRLRTLQEDLQNQNRPIDDADIRLTFMIKRFLDISYLPRREFVIEDHYIYRMMLSDILVYLFEFAFPYIRRSDRQIQALREALDRHNAVRIGQKSQLIQVLFRPVLRLARRNQSHQHRMLYIWFNLNHGAKLQLFFDIYKKNRPCGRFFLNSLTLSLVNSLFTDTEFFNDCAVTLDVFCLQVIQHTTTLSYQSGQRALCTEVLAVFLQVLGQVVDTEGEQCDLALSRTGVFCVVAVLSEQLCFLLRS